MDFKVKVTGHVKAEDRKTGEILLDKNNAIHNENMALAIARGLANEQNHQIYTMSFGNGGTYVETGVGGGYQLHYNSPNILDSNATLYHETYNEIIDDDQTSSNGNQVVTSTGSIENTFLVICTCTLSSLEPSGQSTDDSFDEVLTSTSSTEEIFSFDELGLKTPDNKLLSHIIFNPIEKTANREIIFTYTLTVSIC